MLQIVQAYDRSPIAQVATDDLVCTHRGTPQRAARWRTPRHGKVCQLTSLEGGP